MVSLNFSPANIIMNVLILFAVALLVVLTVHIVRLNRKVRKAKEQADSMAALAQAMSFAEQMSQSAEDIKKEAAVVYEEALGDVPAEEQAQADEAAEASEAAE